jgi:hypothetical protein
MGVPVVELKYIKDTLVKVRWSDAAAKPFSDLRAGHGRQGEAVAQIDDICAKSALSLNFRNIPDILGELVAVMELEAGDAEWIVGRLQLEEELGSKSYLWQSIGGRPLLEDPFWPSEVRVLEAVSEEIIKRLAGECEAGLRWDGQERMDHQKDLGRVLEKPRVSLVLGRDVDGRLKNGGAVWSTEGDGRGFLPNLERGETHSATMKERQGRRLDSAREATISLSPKKK